MVTLCFVAGGLCAQSETEKIDPGDGDDRKFIHAKDPKDIGETKTKASMSRWVSASVSTKPRRVAPGESGVLYIMLTFKSDAVMAGSAKTNVKYAQRYGPMTLAQWELSPAKPSRYYEKLESQPVREDSAVISIPFSVDADAKHRKYRLAFTVESDLMHGLRAQDLGEFVMRVSGNVEVGKSLPNARRRSVGETMVTDREVPVEDAGRDRPDSGRKPSSDGELAPDPVDPDREASNLSSSDSVNSMPSADTGSDNSLLLLVGGGVLVIGVGLALLRARK